MGESSYKAAKGLIRVRVRMAHEKVKNITISGDFFMYPEDELWKLEKALVGTSVKREDILSTIRQFYESRNILTPGVSPEDFAEAIVRGVGALTA